MKTTKNYYKSYSDFVMSGIIERNKEIDEGVKRFKGMLDDMRREGGETVVKGEFLCTAMDVVAKSHKQIIESEHILKTIYKPSVYLMLKEYGSELWELLKLVDDLLVISNERKYSLKDVEKIPFAKYIKYWNFRLDDIKETDFYLTRINKEIDFRGLEKLMNEVGNDDAKAPKMFSTIKACLKFENYCFAELTAEILGDKKLVDFMEECVKAFCFVYRDEEEERLIRQMNSERFRKENTEEDWCEMRIKEERVIRSVVYGGMTCKTEKTIREFYDAGIKNNVELMEEFNRYLPHEDLLDVRTMLKVRDMYRLLRHDNVFLLYRMMLRFDIIQYHIYGEGMKREFEVWMGVAKRDESDRSEEELRESNKVLKDGVPFVRLYALIKEVAGWISYNYEWYAVYRFLGDKEYLKKDEVSKFCEQMTEWVAGDDVKKCDNTDVSRYNQLLANRKFEEWERISDVECKKVDKKLNSGAVDKIHELYKRMKEKHDDL